MNDQIIDVTGRKLIRDDWKQIIGTGKICRLNKDQFKSIVPKDKEDYASRVWDLYDSMPVGTYYMKTARPFHEGITAKEVEQNGSPFQFFSRKRFEGFTTAIPFINVYSFQCFPDRQVYAPWELLGSPNIQLNRSSTLWDKMTLLDENDVREVIDRTYSQWQRFFPKVVSEDNREEVRSLRDEYHFTLKDLSDARGRDYQTWDDVFNHLMEDVRTPTKFGISSISPMGEEKGYAPEISEVQSPKEISDFVIRYLSFQDNGRILPARIDA